MCHPLHIESNTICRVQQATNTTLTRKQGHNHGSIWMCSGIKNNVTVYLSLLCFIRGWKGGSTINAQCHHMGELRTFVHFELCFEAQPEVVGEPAAQGSSPLKMSCSERILSFLCYYQRHLLLNRGSDMTNKSCYSGLLMQHSVVMRSNMCFPWGSTLKHRFIAVPHTCKTQPLQKESLLHQWHAAWVCSATHILCAIVPKHAFRCDGRAEDKNKQQRSLAFWHKASLPSPTGETYCCFRLPGEKCVSKSKQWWAGETSLFPYSATAPLPRPPIILSPILLSSFYTPAHFL